MFCATGNPITGEHVFAEWIHDMLGPSVGELFRSSTENVARWNVTGRSSQGKVWRVCASCNNEWMSRLEARAKRTLAAMIRDISIPLDREDQALIAQWAMKTAMVCEASNPPEHWFYTEAERDHLRALLSLPSDSFVWIGRYARSDLGINESRKLYRTESKDRDILGEGFSTAFVIAHLVIQVATVRRDRGGPEDRAPELRHRLGRWSPYLTQIWPTRAPFSWPPSSSFMTEEALEILYRRFTPNRPTG